MTRQILPSKICFKCRKRQPVSSFYAHPNMADGRLGKCKECTKADVRASYAANRDQRSEYDRQRAKDPARKEDKAEYQRRSRDRHPDKWSARAKVQHAVKVGRLVRAACEVCGSADSQAHHDNYSKPLEVRWLCFTHHRMEHGQLAHLLGGALEDSPAGMELEILRVVREWRAK